MTHHGVNVSVRNSDGDLQEGTLLFDGTDSCVVFGTGEKLSSKQNPEIRFQMNISRIVNPNGKSENIPLVSPVEVILKPSVCRIRPYSVGFWQMPEDVFPPSTNGFFGRMRDDGEPATFSVHKITESDSYWLFISSFEDGIIYESHEIQPFEIGVLCFIEDWLIMKEDRERIRSSQIDAMTNILEKNQKILETPSPTWDQLAPLVGGVVIPNFRRGKTMLQTVSQLVPSSFPKDVKDQLMMFLAFVMTDTIPKEDPIDYFSIFSDQPILRALLMGHTQFVLDGLEWPSYVKLMMLADRGQLEEPKRPLPEPARVPWIMLWEKLVETFPDWRNIAVAHAKTMNSTNKVFLGLPVTRSKAKKSKRMWKERMALMVSNLSLRVNVNPQLLGLTQLLYIGAAYRWPHRHMSWITRLGEISEQPAHFQVMLMPPTALERVKRFVPSVREVTASYRTSNLDLFQNDENLWRMSTSKILDFASRKSSPRRLSNRFGQKSDTVGYSISRNEALVLDFTSRNPDLSNLELADLDAQWGISRRTMRATLTDLHKRGILDYYYEIMINNDLISIFLLADGEIAQISALAEVFLSQTPTSLAMLSEKGRSCVIMARIPETDVYTIASELPSLADSNGVRLRIMRPRAVRTYSHNLYQRLLKPDGTWDDDVSAFLSQARSKRRELSESNA